MRSAPASTPWWARWAPRSEAPEFAGEIDADLIVAGSSATAGVVSRLLGSVPLDLVQKADRQVMVITDPGGG